MQVTAGEFEEGGLRDQLLPIVIGLLRTVSLPDVDGAPDVPNYHLILLGQSILSPWALGQSILHLLLYCCWNLWTSL